MSDGDDIPNPDPDKSERSSWNWIRAMAALLFVVSAIAAAIAQTPPAYVGLAVIFILCLMMALIGVAKPRHYAVGAFAVAAILLAAGVVAGPAWPMEGPGFMKLAISPALFGVSTLFWSQRQDAPWHWTSNVAGVLAAATIAVVAYVCLFGDYENFFVSPWLAVVLVAVTGLANMAGKAWRWPLALSAIPAMISIVARHIYANLPDRLTSGMAQASNWVQSTQIWPIAVPAVIWLLFCLQQRPGRQPTLVGLLFVVLVGIMAREVWMLVGVGSGK